MSLYNHPKEHKLRKPKAGFQRSKQLLINELYELNPIQYNSDFLDLDKRTIQKTEKEQNWKVWKKLIIVFAISLPMVIALHQFVLKNLAEAHQKNIERANRIPLSYFDKLEFGFKALSKKEFQKAIFYYKSAERDSKTYLNGTLGLLLVYHQMCEDGNIYGCDLLNETLSEEKIKKRFSNKSKKEIIVDLDFRKERLEEIHLGKPNLRKHFNHTLRKAYIAFSNEDYNTAINNFQHIEQYYKHYINGTIGLLSVYDEMCQNEIQDGCQLLNEKFSSPNATSYFRGKSKNEKMSIIRNWKKSKLNLHLKEVTFYDFYTSGY